MEKLTTGIEVDGHRVHVRAGRSLDLSWADDFRKKHRDLGFIPRNAMASYLATRRVTIAEVDGDQVAYIVANPKQNGTMHVAQLGVLEELWRNGIGAMMLEHIARVGVAMLKTGITAKPATGLMVERALHACTWRRIGTSATRSRLLSAWYLALPAGEDLPPMLPPMSNKSRYNATWRIEIPRVRLQGPRSRATYIACARSARRPGPFARC